MSMNHSLHCVWKILWIS